MIRTYKKGDLSSGFVGVRVAMSVNGKLKQKYYAHSLYSTELALELAYDYENELRKKQLHYFYNNIFSKETNTGIKGLCFFYAKSTRNNRSYNYPCFQYMFNKNGKLKHKVFYICNDRLSDNLWFDICLFIKNSRNLLNKTFDNILDMKPSEEKISKLKASYEQ